MSTQQTPPTQTCSTRCHFYINWDNCLSLCSVRIDEKGVGPFRYDACYPEQSCRHQLSAEEIQSNWQERQLEQQQLEQVAKTP